MGKLKQIKLEQVTLETVDTDRRQVALLLGLNQEPITIGPDEAPYAEALIQWWLDGQNVYEKAYNWGLNGQPLVIEIHDSAYAALMLSIWFKGQRAKLEAE